MDVCKFFNRCVYYLVEKALGDVKKFDPYYLLHIVALWAGRVCLVIFLASVSAVTYVVLRVIIPYEWSVCESVPYFVFRVLVFFYLYYSLIFHYYKARTLEPVKNPGAPGDKFCIPCNNWKGPSTSHCKACARCIYRIDHHCPHIGQCVGAHNQAHFFLFLLFLLISSGLFFWLAPTYWWHWIETRFEIMKIPEEQCWYPFCFNRLYYLIFSSYGREDTAIKFCFVLFAMLHWIMWGFVCLYIYIISSGITVAMKLFKKSDAESRKPRTWITLIMRWRKYMNCNEEPLWKAFLIPKSRRLIEYNDQKEMII